MHGAIAPTRLGLPLRKVLPAMHGSVAPTRLGFPLRKVLPVIHGAIAPTRLGFPLTKVLPAMHGAVAPTRRMQFEPVDTAGTSSQFLPRIQWRQKQGLQYAYPTKAVE